MSTTASRLPTPSLVGGGPFGLPFDPNRFLGSTKQKSPSSDRIHLPPKAARCANEDFLLSLYFGSLEPRFGAFSITGWLPKHPVFVFLGACWKGERPWYLRIRDLAESPDFQQTVFPPHPALTKCVPLALPVPPLLPSLLAATILLI